MTPAAIDRAEAVRVRAVVTAETVRPADILPRKAAVAVGKASPAVATVSAITPTITAAVFSILLTAADYGAGLIACRFAPFRESTMDEEAVALGALKCGGYSKARQCDVDMLLSVVRADRFATGLSLRKTGQRMSPEAVTALGFRSSLIMTEEFWDSLTVLGRADPRSAAQSIVSAYWAIVAHDRQLRQGLRVFGSDAMVQIYPNNTLAGPCQACIELAKKPVPWTEAPAGPLPRCPHPEECSLTWRFVIIFDE